MAHLHLATVLIGACLWANTLAFSAVPSLSRTSVLNGASIRLRLTTNDDEECASNNISDRRSAILKSASAVSSFLVATTALSSPANAGIDVNALKALPVEGDTTGVKSRLQQIESVNGPRPDDSKDIAFEVLPSGASYREYREGKGDAAIKQGSKVAAEMTIRCKSFATANEPGGREYFSTKVDTDFNELAWTVGSGEFPPELEECMVGMHKGAVRRIELPSTAVFAARNKQQLPLPSEKNKDGNRVYDRLFKTDATLLFEVLVTRIK
mmetsp:Transcript_3485/g.6365  ORF Transcript_3485/g.6365 Transcript_3485/m.6365 type:complete len:268 (+) Transcript_3485:103-906(+)|eukprot:CAMPEP_0201883738 /NCGR_PEP_ID=MMETSP0902-20130614/16208_1 /ASSEMBLY_ACC=CAM_ASM_000551 /TAXON_ID=420261 /ORGANISM="Thalassiosira antarctica, Strain CCMP982" /LENGTH=267 /DNA_ID=CAMNT_0048412591 /DNA_START=69 /DNA_END=872 /DNA_ORIENTATION=+